jgi:hypothetical protein
VLLGCWQWLLLQVIRLLGSVAASVPASLWFLAVQQVVAAHVAAAAKRECSHYVPALQQRALTVGRASIAMGLSTAQCTCSWTLTSPIFQVHSYGTRRAHAPQALPAAALLQGAR